MTTANVIKNLNKTVAETSSQPTDFSTPEIDSEQQELDLNKTEDLQIFLVNTQDIYQTAMQYEQLAESDMYSSLSLDEIFGKEVFTILQHKFQVLEKHVLDHEQKVSAGEVVNFSDQQIDYLQKLYNDILFLTEYITSIYESAESPAAVTSEATESPEESEQSLVEVVTFNVVMPEVGPDGLIKACELRELLLEARDTDTFFLYDTKKQLVADKMIRKLAGVSIAGLDLEDINYLNGLATSISLSFNLDDVEIEEEELTSHFSDPVPVFIDPVVTSGRLSIESEDDERALSIRLTKRVRDKYQNVKESTKKSLFKIKATDQKKDNKQQINNSLLSEEKRQDKLDQKKEKVRTVLIDKYLKQDFYVDFVQQYYDSPVEFERLLSSVIIRIEASTVDMFERWLGEKFFSPFKFIQDMKVSEVTALAEDVEVRRIMLDQKIKYETFVTWADLVTEMFSLVEADDQILFGDLFIRWVIESEIEYLKQEQEQG